MKDNYDPEEHQKNDFKGFQHSLRARWHGRDKLLHLFYYKIFQSFKGGALFGEPLAGL